MLRGSFQPHATASGGRSRRCVSSVAARSSTISAGLLRAEPVERAGRTNSLIQRSEKPREVERVLVVVEIRADVHPAGAHDPADDARPRAARSRRSRAGRAREESASRASGIEARKERSVMECGSRKPSRRRREPAAAKAIIGECRVCPRPTFGACGTATSSAPCPYPTAFASSDTWMSSHPCARTWLRLMTDEVAVDPDFFEAALHAEEQILRPHVVVLERGRPRPGDADRTDRAPRARRPSRLPEAVRAVRPLRSRSSTAASSATSTRSRSAASLGSVRTSLEAEGADVRDLPLPAARLAALPDRRDASHRSWPGQRVADSEVHWELDAAGLAGRRPRRALARARARR